MGLPSGHAPSGPHQRLRSFLPALPNHFHQDFSICTKMNTDPSPPNSVQRPREEGPAPSSRQEALSSCGLSGGRTQNWACRGGGGTFSQRRPSALPHCLQRPHLLVTCQPRPLETYGLTRPLSLLEAAASLSPWLAPTPLSSLSQHAPSSRKPARPPPPSG